VVIRFSLALAVSRCLQKVKVEPLNRGRRFPRRPDRGRYRDRRTEGSVPTCPWVRTRR
jgi:hypothetical protein